MQNFEQTRLCTYKYVQGITLSVLVNKYLYVQPLHRQELHRLSAHLEHTVCTHITLYAHIKSVLSTISSVQSCLQFFDIRCIINSINSQNFNTLKKRQTISLNFQYFGKMEKMKECFVKLDIIDVSSYRNTDTAELINPSEHHSMEIEHEDDLSNENSSRGTKSQVLTNSKECDPMNIEHENDSDNEIASAEFLLFSSCYLLAKRQDINRKKRKSRTVWVREWLNKRQQDGAYNKLLVELRNGDNGEQRLYRDFLRMTHDDFNYLLELVEPLIEKSNTKFRESIPAGERLALTLQYLATGSSFRSLQFTFYHKQLFQ